MHSLRGEDDRPPDGTHAPDSPRQYKVVVNFGGGEVLKGHLETTEDLDVAVPFGHPCKENTAFSVKVAGAETPREVRLRDIKCLYVVKSLKGDSTRKDLHFYSNGPNLGSVWVEVRFKDNEIVEGLVENSAEHLVGEGFSLRPSDPSSNNLACYINKASIAGYRVLGVRATTR